MGGTESPSVSTVERARTVEADRIAHLIADVLDNPRDPANIDAVRAKVNALTARFPVYK